MGGSIKNKILPTRAYKFCLEVDRINIEISRSGFLTSFFKQKWIRCWCVLSGTQFQFFKSQNGEIFTFFDLKYATFCKIDENGYLVFKSVRPSNDNDKDLPVLQSRNNFVVINHRFRARNIRYLNLWMADFNQIVQTLQDWNVSFLYASELHM